MMRKLLFLLGLISLVSIPARAQVAGDKIEVFGGYSYTRFDSVPKANLNGWDLSGQYKVRDRLGAVLDFGGSYGSVGSITGTKIYTYMVGPQYSLPRRISPFAQALIGGAHFDGSIFLKTSLAWEAGGGVDLRMPHGLYWRVLQADYLHTKFFDVRQANIRISTGVVFHF